jgi:hypothetical protein
MSTAPSASSRCEGLEAPMIGAVTPGLRDPEAGAPEVHVVHQPASFVSSTSPSSIVRTGS